MDIKINGRIKPLNLTLELSGDKSITHRAFIISSIANGEVEILNPSLSYDCEATLTCLKQLGIKVFESKKSVKINARSGFKEAKDILDAKNSKTTVSLLLGALAPKKGLFVFTGDKSLKARPFKKSLEFLKKMGAFVYARAGEYLPIALYGNSKLKGGNFVSTSGSAQLKSTILLAALNAQDKVCYEEAIKTRDHTERMLELFKFDIKKQGLKTCVIPGKKAAHPKKIAIPGDVSIASNFIALALLIPDSKLLLKNVLLNETRLGFVNLMKKAGAKITVSKKGLMSNEPYGDITVEYSGRLNAVEVNREDVPSLIDEIPLIAIMAATMSGESVIKGAYNLRLKESDRIKASLDNLRSAGIVVKEYFDGFSVRGKNKIKPATFKSFNDHRIAMAYIVFSMFIKGESTVKNIGCIGISSKEFLSIIKKILKSQ